MENRELEMELLKQEYEKKHMTAEQVGKMKQKIDEAKMEKRRIRRKNIVTKAVLTAAAVAAAFVILPNTSMGAAHAMSQIPLLGKLVEVVTFRDYQYEDDRHMADISVPEIIAEETVHSREQETLQKTAAQINGEIDKITAEIVSEFEESIEDEEGYQDVMVKHEVISTTRDYFTLKLICYQGAGSGAEWDYFYTIDLNTGKRIGLKDLFVENAPYITAISDNIKKQMKEQMEADENIYYWLEDDMTEWNFDKITEETSFYLNDNNQIVIAFNEGDVAPMYMGCVEFVIENQAVENIRK